MELAGAQADRAKTASEFDHVLASADVAIVDLTARTYDPFDAIERAVSAGVRVLAVGPHDDVTERKRALERGAERVLAYRKLFEDGPGTVAGFVNRVARATEAPA